MCQSFSATDIEIIDELGAGAHGTVYRGLCRKEEVAIKRIVPVNALHAQRARREIKILSRVTHPNIVRFLGYCQADDALLLIMEFVPGKTLRESRFFSILGDETEGDELSPTGSLERLDLFAHGIGMQILRGLEALHSAGIVHRDLKPENVLLTDTEPQCAKLTDFGLSKILAESRGLTVSGTRLGTPLYQAKELEDARDADARCDLYSFGMMAREVFFRRNDFRSLDYPQIRERRSSLVSLEDGLRGYSLTERQEVLVYGIDMCVHEEATDRLASAEFLALLLASGRRLIQRHAYWCMFVEDHWRHVERSVSRSAAIRMFEEFALSEAKRERNSDRSG
ncbi:MAG: serine/threonine-protein kinase [Vicinamibacteria bacterium]